MNGLRRTFSSPNLTPSGSNGSFNPHGGNYSQNYNDYGQGGLGQGGFNQGQNGQFNQRHSMNYGRSNPYQVKIDENYTYANFSGCFLFGSLWELSLYPTSIKLGGATVNGF